MTRTIRAIRISFYRSLRTLLTAMAASERDHHGAHEPDEAVRAAARVQFEKRMQALGGVVFNNKEDALSYIRARNLKSAESVSEQDIPDSSLYVVMPAKTAAIILPEAQLLSDYSEDDLVLLGAEWCSICKDWVVTFVKKLLEDVLLDIAKAVLIWCLERICSACNGPIYQDTTIVETECPDCGPEGDITLVEANDRYATFYCYRSLTTWTEINPY